MKLLFDQNISFRITHKLKDVYPGCKQLKDLGLENTSDTEIWEYSKKNHFAIVTFDADFADLANIKGSPPKIIWLRTGNMTTDRIAELLFTHQETISEFLHGDDFKDIDCLEIE